MIQVKNENPYDDPIVLSDIKPMYLQKATTNDIGYCVKLKKLNNERFEHFYNTMLTPLATVHDGITSIKPSKAVMALDVYLEMQEIKCYDLHKHHIPVISKEQCDFWVSELNKPVSELCKIGVGNVNIAYSMIINYYTAVIREERKRLIFNSDDTVQCFNNAMKHKELMSPYYITKMYSNFGDVRDKIRALNIKNTLDVPDDTEIQFEQIFDKFILQLNKDEETEYMYESKHFINEQFIDFYKTNIELLNKIGRVKLYDIFLGIEVHINSYEVKYYMENKSRFVWFNRSDIDYWLQELDKDIEYMYHNIGISLSSIVYSMLVNELRDNMMIKKYNTVYSMDKSHWYTSVVNNDISELYNNDCIRYNKRYKIMHDKIHYLHQIRIAPN